MSAELLGEALFAQMFLAGFILMVVLSSRPNKTTLHSDALRDKEIEIRRLRRRISEMKQGGYGLESEDWKNE